MSNDARLESPARAGARAPEAGHAHAHGREALLGTGLVLLSGLGYGAVVVMARIAYDGGSNAPTSLFVRFGLAGSLLWGMLALRRQVIRLPARRVAALLLMGLLFSGGSVMSFMAVERIPASLAALLFYIYPAIITVFSALVFKTRFSLSRLAVLAASLAGCALTVDVQSGPIDVAGVVLAVVTAFFYSGYVLMGSRVTAGIPALNSAAWVITSAGALMFVVGLSGILDAHLTTDISTRGWLALLALAFFSTVISITAFLAGIARIDLFRAAILSTFEPVVSVTLAALLLGERLSLQQGLGGIVIVGAAVALQMIAHREGRL